MKEKLLLITMINIILKVYAIMIKITIVHMKMMMINDFLTSFL